MVMQNIKIIKNIGRYLFGGGLGTMAMDELQVLEKNLEIWMYHVRSMKVPINLFYHSIFILSKILSYIYL